MGETANGRTGEARIRAAGSMSLMRFLRPGERIGLVRCCRLAHSLFRPFAHSLPGSYPFAQSISLSIRLSESARRVSST